MLSKEENERLTRVGPGTPMGEVLRRYWWPVGCTDELSTKPRRLKLLGEELVLYRGEDGQPALMELRCAHRNVALDYGRVEGDCIRCPYHGWLYDRTGQCVEQPAEPEESTFKNRVRLNAYPTREFGGLVYGYLGPAPAPLLPRYDVVAFEDGVKTIQIQPVYANWLQHVENIVDISHLAWLHGARLHRYGGKKLAYHWERTRWGLNNVMQIAGIDQTHVSCYAFPTVNRFTLPPVDGSRELVQALIYRVPVDDVSSRLYMIRCYRDDTRALKLLGERPTRPGVYEPNPTDWWGIDMIDQDRMAVEQQGEMTDRQREHLSASDEGVVLVRQMLRDALAAVAAGQDPLGVVRDPAEDAVIALGAVADMYDMPGPRLVAAGAR
ncbi:MAG TPA: Rieske 2Fe-2S domain-containing protein [Chloroflexota bacterium]|nr:Rieske 2Fe-2S domain-containing protein [Chloroflexota bacterium]